MAFVAFAAVLQRHVACPPAQAPGTSVREVLDTIFASNPLLKSYIVDDQSALRKHMLIFVDGRLITDRTTLSDPVSSASKIYVMQSLSGG